MRLDFVKEGSPAVGDVHVNAPLRVPTPRPDRGERTAHDIEDERKASLRSGPVGAVDKSQVAPRTLYVSRKVVNAADIIAWAKKAGFKTTYPADELHVTVAFSRAPVNWMEAGQSYGWDPEGTITVPPGGPRQLERFGLTQNCAVLLFASDDLQWRHEWLNEIGCSWDWDGYQPHITISQDIEGLDIASMDPYQGEIVLGPELFAEVKENAMAGVVEKKFETFFKVAGGDEALGVVFGWGIVCTEGGVPHYDLQKNHIPEGAMAKAVTDFMKDGRMAGQEHFRMGAGTVVHSFPLTKDIADAMGIACDKTGWMVGVAADPEMLAAFKSKQLTGFSIGGDHEEIDGKPVQEMA